MDHVPALAAGPARGWAELALSRRVAGRPVCPACVASPMPVLAAALKCEEGHDEMT